MAINYKVKMSIISTLLIICFIFSTVLVCYAYNNEVNGNNEKKDYSLFNASMVDYYICLPTDRLSEVSNNRDSDCSEFSSRYDFPNATQIKVNKEGCIVYQGTAYTSREIVVSTYKKDGKK